MLLLTWDQVDALYVGQMRERADELDRMSDGKPKADDSEKAAFAEAVRRIKPHLTAAQIDRLWADR